MDETFIPCVLRELPPNLWPAADAIAVQENPANAPPLHRLSKLAEVLGLPEIHPERISVITSKYWGAKGVKLGVSFMDTPSQEIRSRILKYLNLWNAKGANILFQESAQGEVRIARTPGEGYYSYLGTDILSIQAGECTMNLDSITMSTPDAECMRVIPHEGGHTLGCPHEHMRAELVARIDPNKAIQYFWQTQRWTPQDVYQQVLTPLNERNLMGTPVDQTSSMCYQLPGSITFDGQPITGGSHVNETDFAFMGKIYPGAVVPPVVPPDAVGDKKIITLTFPVPVPVPKVTHR